MHCELHRMPLIHNVLRCVVPLHAPDKHLICRWRRGPCKCLGDDSDQNAPGQVWYGLTKAAHFQVVSYRVEKLKGELNPNIKLDLNDSFRTLVNKHNPHIF